MPTIVGIKRAKVSDGPMNASYSTHVYVQKCEHTSHRTYDVAKDAGPDA